MALDLDPRFTFDAFVVGPANRLAVAAARRVAESPGSTYNPLVIYSSSGLGKTHLLGAIGHHAERVHSLAAMYDATEHLMEAVGTAVAAGDRDMFRGRLRDVDMLLLDDVQFLAGQRQVQEELLRALDALAGRGAQVVLSSDRPPQEIDALDDRLLSRLSGGLIVDMSAPDFETRIAIARRKAGERGIELAPDIFQALARIAFTNVRELQGALNRLIAVQELEGRRVTAEQVPQMLGTAADRGRDEFGEFISEITGTVSAVVEEGQQRLADALMTWEGEGFRTVRLDNALAGSPTAAQAREVVERYESDVMRLREIGREIQELDPDAPELEADALRDPDRLPEAEALLRTVRDRRQPPPAPPPGPTLEDLGGPDSLATRAARAVADKPGEAYNPLYVLGPAGARREELMTALGNTLRTRGLGVAYIDGASFAEELIGAIERSGLTAWRARYRRAEVLILDALDELAGMERGHDELFHLFEELHKERRQLVFSAAVPPNQLPLPARLQSRLEAGLVVEVEPESVADPAAGDPGSTSPSLAGDAGSTGARPTSSPQGPAPTDGTDHPAEPWFLDREKVLWEWPGAEEWIQESPD